MATATDNNEAIDATQEHLNNALHELDHFTPGAEPPLATVLVLEAHSRIQLAVEMLRIARETTG